MVLKHSDRKERGGEKGTTKENGERERERESCFEERLQVRKRQRGKRGNGRTILRGGGTKEMGRRRAERVRCVLKDISKEKTKGGKGGMEEQY